MRVVVCVRQATSGDINPFDACAYEAALRIPGAEVVLLSMGPGKVAAFLENLSRLGAAQSVLLCDAVFAGADTLATAYTLSLAVARLQPDLILCGRQTVDGDTGQVGPELACMSGYTLLPFAMSLQVEDTAVTVTDRAGDSHTVPFPALVTVERINTLRLPRLRSQVAPLTVWDAAALQADVSRCGQAGSPTRVVRTFENEQDRRHCTFISPEQLPEVIEEALTKQQQRVAPSASNLRLKEAWIIGPAAREMAETVAETVTEIPMDTPERLAARMRAVQPPVVLWGSDPLSKTVAPQVAALLQTGLCADCTALETDGEQLFMYRPAFSGNILAKIRCETRPQMATVRTLQPTARPLMLGVGLGAKDSMSLVRRLASCWRADLAATRLMVDHDYLPYEQQVGLTGRTVSPAVYVALGVSGAVHHIAGVRGSDTIIAVNRDPQAPIFNYADYGVVADVETLQSLCPAE